MGKGLRCSILCEGVGGMGEREEPRANDFCICPLSQASKRQRVNTRTVVLAAGIRTLEAVTGVARELEVVAMRELRCCSIYTTNSSEIFNLCE